MVCFSFSLVLCSAFPLLIIIYNTGIVSTICTIPKPRFIDIANSQFVLVTSGEGKKNKVQLTDNDMVEHFAGKGGKGNEDGTAKKCQFNCPGSVVMDRSSSLCYVVDRDNFTIRKIVVV